MKNKFKVIIVDQDGKIVPGFPTAVPIDTYNYAIGFVNPRYAEWNDEFDRDYPGLDGFSREYNAFITKRVNEVLEKSKDGHGTIGGRKLPPCLARTTLTSWFIGQPLQTDFLHIV